ncbi:MAG: hypothetical protein R3B82_12100 [Sandaracinaceae bacterium]
MVSDLRGRQVTLPSCSTHPDLLRDETRPYFLWWTECDPEEVAYWLGALLREANTRDVWLFTIRTQIADAWPRLLRHLGKSRERWAWLLGLDGTWPPRPSTLSDGSPSRRA